MQRLQRVFLFCLLVVTATRMPGGSAPSLHAARSIKTEPEIRGAAMSAGGTILYTWGDGLTAWSIPTLEHRVLAAGKFAEGGCLVEIPGSSQPALVLNEGTGLGTLTLRQAPDWAAHDIDTAIEMKDCLDTDLLGHRGVLMIQRGAQVRFYEYPRRAGAPWGYNEIYSIYTPSYQTGLLRADIDGDGHSDILAGNYWIRSPERYELHWRLFAINTYSEEQNSASLRLALTGKAGGLVVSQGERNAGRVTLFKKPADPKLLWEEHRLDTGLPRGAPPLAYPHALTACGWNEDGRVDILVGEHNGDASRLLLFANQGNGNFTPVQLASGHDFLFLFAKDKGLVSVGRDNVTLWNYQKN